MDNIPQDMRDLLIRLDQRVSDGFFQVNAKLDAIERRADGHDSRIAKIELELADRSHLKARFFELEDNHDAVEKRVSTIETTAEASDKTTTRMVTILWAVLGPTVLAVVAKMVGVI